MAEIVVQGNTFKIKGTEPTPNEQVAIDSVLAAKGASGEDGGLSFDDEMSLMITPEDVLSDAQKGKYNKDTESFLASPDFMRIVTEVGLSIAGGIAGVAAAPFTGGSSLVGTGLMAARVARIARPLLNLSKNKQRLIGGVTGAGLGGGAGAAISQTFDPKESIVREVARGTAQGAFGELLGFGMAGGLAKVYNKVTGLSIKTIDGAQDVIKGMDVDKKFYKEIIKIKETGKLPSKETLDDLVGKNLSPKELKTARVLSPTQRTILESKDLVDDVYDSAQKANPDFFKYKKGLFGKTGKYAFEQANIIAGKLTQQPGVEFASSLSAASIGGAGFIRTSEGFGRLMTIESIDNFTKVLTKDLPKIDYDLAADSVTAFLQSQIRGGREIFESTKDKLYKDLYKKVDDVILRADGSYNPAYNVKIRPDDFNVGQKIIIDSKGGTGTIFGLNKTNLKLGNMNDNYVIIKDKALFPGANKKIVLSKEIVDELNSTVKPKIKVYNDKDGAYEMVPNLFKYINKTVGDNARGVQDEGIEAITSMVQNLKGATDYNNFGRVYSAIKKMRVAGTPADSVRAETLKRMEAMLANSPLPASVNTARRAATDFTRLGNEAFQGKVVSDLLKTDFGQERLYKQIIGAGKPSYFRAFQESMEAGTNKIKAGGKKYNLFSGKVKLANGVVPDSTAIQGALQGQFFKDFLRNTVNKEGQYFKLDSNKAEKFLSDYKWLMGDDPITGKPVGFLAQSQIKGIRDYVKRISAVEGKIKPPGAGGSSGDMLVQMKQAGAISQIVGVVGFGTGTIDPGAATFFVLGPAGLAYAMSRPATTRALIEGLGKGSKGIDSYQGLTRYVGQLSSALVSEGIIGPVEAKAAVDKVQGNKEAYEQYFKTGIMPGAPAKREFEPENAPEIKIDPYLQSGIQRQGSGQRRGSIVQSGSNVPLPNVQPSNLPLTGQSNQQNMQMAQTLGLFNQGGIVSAKKTF